MIQKTRTAARVCAVLVLILCGALCGLAALMLGMLGYVSHSMGLERLALAFFAVAICPVAAYAIGVSFFRDWWRTPCKSP